MINKRGARRMGNNNPTVLPFKMEMTEEELKQMPMIMEMMEEKDYSNITRAQWQVATKFISVHKMEELFLSEQYARGNSEITILHYKQSFRKLEKFFAWLTNKELYENETIEKSIIRGAACPIAIFEADDFEKMFRSFLLDVEEVRETTVNTYFRDYRAIAYYIQDKGIIPKREIKFKNVETDIRDCYTEVEMEKLLKIPKKDAGFIEWRNWAIVCFIFGCGQRASTVINMKVKDIDFIDNEININKQKNGHKTRIPMTAELRRCLRLYIDKHLTNEDGTYNSEYLFPSSYIDATQPITRARLYETIKKYNQSRGVNKAGLHLMRHTFCKMWIVGNGDLESLRKMLGHSNLEMVSHYANLYSKDLAPKAEAFSTLSQITKKTVAAGRRRR